MKAVLFTIIATTLFFTLGCGRGKSPDELKQSKDAPPQKETRSTPPLLPAEVTGGCNISLRTPRSGETIDLRNGKGYQFAWTTSGTYCETPYRLFLAGNPANPQTGENIFEWQLSESVGQISKTGGGYKNIYAPDFEGITSQDGTFQWVVFGWFGSHPSSQVFKVLR